MVAVKFQQEKLSEKNDSLFYYIRKCLIKLTDGIVEERIKGIDN